MKTVLRCALLSLLSILPLAAGAGEPLLRESANQALPAPSADKAQIVFIESTNSIAGAIMVGLYELDGDRRQFLALMNAHSKVALELSPGHHRLMSNTVGFAHFLDADVEAGKTYYVLVRFVYARGFQLRPLRSAGSSEYSVNNPEFGKWMSSTRFVETTPKGVAAFEKVDKHIAKSQAKGQVEWDAKTPAERAELTLTPADAVAPAVP